MIDQLRLNALGGVADQAMSCNQAVIVAINPHWYREQLDEVPPVFNAHTAQEVCDKLLLCYNNAASYRYVQKHASWGARATDV